MSQLTIRAIGLTKEELQDRVVDRLVQQVIDSMSREERGESAPVSDCVHQIELGRRSTAMRPSLASLGF